MGIHLDKIETFDALESELYYSDLGKTFDTAFLKTRRQLLVGSPVPESSNSGSDILTYSFASSQKEVSLVTNASAAGKSSFGLGKGKADASVKKFFNTNSYTCYVFGYIRLNHPRIYLPNSIIEPNVNEYLSNAASPFDMARKLGDEVITHVSIVSELLVKLEIQTKNETQKKNVEASASGSWLSSSGSGSFSQISGKFTDKKAIKFEVIGNITNLPTQLTAQSVDQLMLNFPITGRGNHRIIEYTTQPVDQVPQLINYEFSNVAELGKRRRFIMNLDKIFQDLDDWENDINYVLSPANKQEFTPSVINQAGQDITKIYPMKLKLEEIFENAEYYWLTNGQNGNAFDNTLLQEFPTEFPIYARKEPTPQSVQPPKKKPARDRSEHHDHGEAAGAGGRH